MQNIEFIEIVLLLLLFAAFAHRVALKINMPTEIFLLLATLVLSLFPTLPSITLKPETTLFLFIPPIIYSAAFFTSWRDFVANKRPITLLAIGLVFFTFLVIAITLKYLIPEIDWTTCFIFGAIVSSTDASAAVTLVKKLNVFRRLVTIVEGESLINDATTLIIYRYSLLALLTGTFSFWAAGFNFLLAGAGGVVVGLVFGYLGAYLYAWLAETKGQILFSLLLPYFIYFISDTLYVSPIIALVTAGIYISRKFPIISNPELRDKARTIWELFIFVLNALIFILIGLQLPSVVKGLHQYFIHQLIWYAVVVNVVIIVLRFIWVFPAAYIPRFISRSLRERDPYPAWTELALLSWINMRGILAFILALSLPERLPSGQPFLDRSLLIFLTYTVILTTLLLPTLTISTLTKIFKLKKDESSLEEEAKARIKSNQAVLTELEHMSQQTPEINDYIEILIQRYRSRLDILQSNLNEFPYSSLNTSDQAIRKLTKKIIEIEREVLLDLRTRGEIHDEVFYRLQKELDLENLRLTTQRI